MIMKYIIRILAVLILVLMEDTHWAIMEKKNVIESLVLILVLMEDTHWVKKSSGRRSKKVLILVLMEDTHWEVRVEDPKNLLSLNPCFNGRYSLRKVRVEDPKPNKGLNPCFNGRYSLSYTYYNEKKTRKSVLILVLMEDTHWDEPVGGDDITASLS